jgi:hypothetical protein
MLLFYQKQPTFSVPSNNKIRRNFLKILTDRLTNEFVALLQSPSSGLVVYRNGPKLGEQQSQYKTIIEPLARQYAEGLLECLSYIKELNNTDKLELLSADNMTYLLGAKVEQPRSVQLQSARSTVQSKPFTHLEKIITTTDGVFRFKYIDTGIPVPRGYSQEALLKLDTISNQELKQILQDLVRTNSENHALPSTLLRYPLLTPEQLELLAKSAQKLNDFISSNV